MTQTYKWWTKQETDFLMANYETMGIDDIANTIGRTREAVIMKRSDIMRKMGKGRQLKNNSNICPKCSKESSNKVMSYSYKKNTIIYSWWCKSCLAEFYRGEMLEYKD
jgi:hypothetical protein